MKKIKTAITILTTTLLLINAGQVFSQDFPSEPTDIEADLDEEFKWLQEESVVMTEIATRTEMDADLVPGMVTILLGKDLKARGIRTVYEALSLVPGLNTYLNTIGDNRVSVRGVGGSFFSGNLKIMLDDLVLNDTLSAAGYGIYEIPVEQVDRIEIIRGPGSVIYGEFAYAGVINVKTRKKGNRINSLCKGDKDSVYRYDGGGTLTYENPEKELSFSLNLAGSESDGPDIKAGKDRIYSGFSGLQLDDYSYAPGPANSAREDKLASLSFNYKGFSASAQYIKTGRGDFFGIIQALPPPSDRILITHDHSAFEIKQELNFSDALEMTMKTGCRIYEFDIENMVGLPPILGVQIPQPDGSFVSIDLTPPDGSLAGPHHEETEIYAGSELIWNGNSHTFLAGMKYSYIEMGDLWVYANTGDENYGVMDKLTGEYNWLKEDRQRDILSFYFQDMFNITDHLTFTAGLRYDHYENHDSEVGRYDSLTPRFSAVYRLTDHNIFKAQYSEAVRPPTFTELYSRGNSIIGGNTNLDPEHIRSWETGYIFRKLKTTVRLTLFYSELEDNIEYPKYANALGGGGETVQYVNVPETITTRGIEAEFRHPLGKNLQLDMNISYASTKGEEGEPLEGATDWLGNMGLLYSPFEDYSLALQYRYAGERHRTPDDDRDNLEACNTFDITANIFNLFTKGLTFRCGIKNLFDADIVYPAPVYKDEAGNIGYTYQDDFPSQGREWWVQLSYDF
ncbi:MAG: TonB-dependent receptor [Desulfobacterales bacterium]|nr:TonB-dependent receptor [Desulfobacterales bacterium]